jgi:L-ascorbate metabolism protein UlaG (beta-lactamase superfamily)
MSRFTVILILLTALSIHMAALAQSPLEFETAAGPLTITPLGHASLLLEVGGSVIHVDPWSRAANYAGLPDADWIFVTHDHRDHLDPTAIEAIAIPSTRIVMDGRSAGSFGEDERVTVLANGQSLDIGAMTLTAVPAYNVVQERQPGQKFHPKGVYNGYVLRIGDFALHVGGDTECVPEFGQLGAITVSFLPINLPFTMPPEEAATCFKVINPEIAVPYHQGEADPQVVADLLANSGIEVVVLELP